LLFVLEEKYINEGTKNENESKNEKGRKERGIYNIRFMFRGAQKRSGKRRRRVQWRVVEVRRVGPWGVLWHRRQLRRVRGGGRRLVFLGWRGWGVWGRRNGQQGGVVGGG